MDQFPGRTQFGVAGRDYAVRDLHKVILDSCLISGARIRRENEERDRHNERRVRPYIALTLFLFPDNTFRFEVR